MNSVSCAVGSLTAKTLDPSFWIITGAALADSINPCAIAVLLILLSALVTQTDRKKTLALGLIFALSIYLAYFLLGIGLLGVVEITNLGGLFHKIIGVFAIVIGLFNIKDFLSYGGGGFVMEIPRKWRPKIKSLLSSVTSPLGVFGMGFVITLFELPCTGGPYLFTLGFLSQNMTWQQIIPILIYYNFIFISPLLLLTFLINFGFSTVEKTNNWKEKNLRILHLITGLIMIILGAWVFLS